MGFCITKRGENPSMLVSDTRYSCCVKTKYMDGKWRCLTHLSLDDMPSVRGGGFCCMKHCSDVLILY
ncbi:hypothetical protein BDV40DRAFT_278666, partial [Aspergillus tamarii]